MYKKFYLALPLVAAAAFTSCSKMGALSSENFNVTPTPLEVIANQVPATINGTFPEKYMKKKAVVTVTPVLKYNGGEAVGQSATFQGEKVEGNDRTIAYKAGGNYTMKALFNYVPAMQQSDLYLRFDARVGKKEVSIPEVKVGYGVVATADLLTKTISSTQASVAPDAFQRVIAQKQEEQIKYLINQANVRSSERKSASVQEFVKMLKEINDAKETRALSNIEISAYASPDGAFDFNKELAEKRQNSSLNFVNKELKKIKMDAKVNTTYTAEDWDGFQQLVAQSNIQDKEVILRVLSMYKDPEEREQQIRNMSAVFTELAETILPELRRARLIINYEVIGRSDAQIVAQYKADASKLSAEELLYGANSLMQNTADKEAWYKKTTQVYPNDYRAYNNLASLAYAKGDIASAESYLKKAKSFNNNAPEVNTNLALLALKEGDVKTAETLLGKGNGAQGFEEIMGNLNIAKGNYTQASTDLRKNSTNSAALAQILNKDYAAAKATLNQVKNADAYTSYLKAVVGARTNDATAVSTNLKKAVSMDASLGARALNDLEFAKYASTIKSIVK